MIDFDYDFDFMVPQIGRYLWVLKQDPLFVETVVVYEEVLKSEWALVQRVRAGEVIRDDAGKVIDRDLVGEFLETIDEIKTYVAQCVIFD